MFEFIIMRQVRHESWMTHRRLPNTTTEEKVIEAATKIAQKYRERVTVLGGDCLAVQTLMYFNEDGERLQ